MAVTLPQGLRTQTYTQTHANTLMSSCLFSTGSLYFSCAIPALPSYVILFSATFDRIDKKKLIRPFRPKHNRNLSTKKLSTQQRQSRMQDHFVVSVNPFCQRQVSPFGHDDLTETQSYFKAICDGLSKACVDLISMKRPTSNTHWTRYLRNITLRHGQLILQRLVYASS